jgi:DNA-binding MarR family transcriptional regulator
MSDVKPSLQFVGIFIPRDLVLRDDISITEKVLAAVIDSLDNSKGCWASNAYLGGLIGIGERQVRDYLARLEALGIIVRSQNEDGSRRISTVYAKAIRDLQNNSTTAENLRPTTAESSHPPRQKTATNRKENNKENNKDISVESSLRSLQIELNKELIDAVTEFVKHRSDIKRPLTQRSLVENLAVIKNQSVTSGTDIVQTAREIISTTIRQGWVGLFPTTNKPAGNKQTLKATDHGKF